MQITGSIDGTFINLVNTMRETPNAKSFVHDKPHTAKYSCYYTYACSYNFYCNHFPFLFPLHLTLNVLQI